MTSTEGIVRNDILESPQEKIITYSEKRHRILDYFLRHGCIKKYGRDENDFRDSACQKLGGSLNLLSKDICRVLGRLLRNVASIRQCVFKWDPHKEKLLDNINFFLIRVHFVVPVFDYNRALKNLEILHNNLSKINFWPQICTQIALTVYITDKNGTNDDKLLQKNIREFCNCSAYAFHRSRNKLRIE